MTYIHRPVVVLPPHAVTSAEICADITAAHAETEVGPLRPRPVGVLHRIVANTGVDTRYWSRPFAEATGSADVGRRAADAFADALDLAEAAARQALAAADLDPRQVDCIITSHTTSWTVPSTDVHLVGRLGLRPDVARIPLATLACAGGAQALVLAHRYVQAHGGGTVLVAVGEALHTIYHRGELEPEHVAYKSLFGDVGAAVVVTAERRGPGMRVEDTLELVLPDSLDRYWGRISAAGLHFDSTRKAPRAARDTLPYLQKWLDGRQLGWCAVHPGGPSIITEVLAGIGLDPREHGGPSFASLRENGNLGGGAIMDVLRRLHDEPPPDGAAGAAVAFGPGFVAAGVRGVWSA